MSRAMSRVCALWVAAFALLACGDDDATPTRVLVIVEADDVIRQQASLVRITAYAGEGAFAPPRDASALVEERDWPVAGETDWPVRVLLEPRRFPEGRYRVVASAEVGAMGTVETQVISGYVAGELRIVRMRLHASCIDADPCATNQRCGASGACEDAEIPPDELECPDGGTCGPRDAGGPDVDGGERDGGELDASACDMTDPECVEGAICVEGRCVPPDAGTLDGGEVDAGPPPPPAGPTIIDYSGGAVPPTQGVEVLGAASRGDGVVVVGSIGDSLRDAFATRYVAGAHDWSVRFGGTLTDRLYSVATNGSQTLAVGLIRVSRSGSNNNDVLLVPVSDDSVGEVTVLGSTDDELLYGVVPGGEVADFVGFGECGSGDDNSRDGLVMGIDIGPEGSARAAWARCYDLGGDEFFTSGVVVGLQIFAVGTEEPGDVAAPGRAIVARVPSPEGASLDPIAFRSSQSGSRAYAAAFDPAANHVLVGAALGTGGSRPAVLRLNANNLMFRSTTVLPIDAVAPTQLVVEGPNLTVVGIRNVGGSYRPFVGRLGGDFSWVEYTNVRVSPFLPTPFAAVGGVSRVVGEGNRAVVDMPFTDTPAASCAGSVMRGSVGGLSNELEMVSITPRTPSFVLATPSIERFQLLPMERDVCP